MYVLKAFSKPARPGHEKGSVEGAHRARLANGVMLIIQQDATYFVCCKLADGDDDEITLETRTGDFEVDGLVSIEDLLDDSGIEIPEGPYETASGFVMHFLGRIPVVGDVVNLNGIRIAVLTMEGKRAGRLLISRN